ncbi:MAG: universal stress protein [Magnetococcales bacterium]|nr:universal stress protein [Magnetococcales bacterium]NGZ26132.1 universal stress protein [Magnetococcales bacterium]
MNSAPPARDSSGKGQLAIRLGYAPGVGKTSRLLMDASRLKEQGVDVVVACLDHLLPADILPYGLEFVSPQTRHFHGFSLDVLDVSAIVARAPQWVVVDDVGKVNPPNSANKRRFQDVLDILQQGISVLCAFDLYQLARYHRQLEKSIKLFEPGLIPDFFLRQANQVVLVDRAVEEVLGDFLQGRVPEGKVASWLKEQLFTSENLLMLRKMAMELLLELAMESRDGKESKPEIHRVMVCITGSDSRQHQLLLTGAKLAGRLRTHWFVVHVEAPPLLNGKTDPNNTRLSNLLSLAAELGAEPVRLQGRDPVSPLLEFARSHSVGHLVVGRREEASLGRWWRPSLLYRLLDGAQGLDVHIVSYTKEEESP